MKTIFVDTAYYLALLGPGDQYHPRAVAWSRQPQIKFLSTEFILLEVGNSLTRGSDRDLFLQLMDALQTEPHTRILPSSNDLFQNGLDLFQRRPDKEWSLTDCISFTVMQNHGINEALTPDHHFDQAGYRALMRFDP